MNYKLRIEVNPAPWTAPTGSVGRGRGGKGLFVQMHKNAELRTYQEAIQEAIQDEGDREALWPYPPIETPVKLVFYFWHRIEKYEDRGGRVRTKSIIDATNAQKALEDALQGIVIKNDNQVKSIQSVMVEEADDIEPLIVVLVMDEQAVEEDRANARTYRVG